MNFLIHTLSSAPQGYFFDDNGSVFSEIQFPSSSGFIDILSQEEKFKQVKNIFYVSGPASFTALRNLSVFLQILTKFSEEKYTVFKIPTQEYLFFLSPNISEIALPVGKRESFIFSKNTTYHKIKNTELSKDMPIYSGNAPDVSVFSSLFFYKEKYKTDHISIEYGAEPNIG